MSGTQIVRSKIKGLEFDLRCSQKLVANNPTRRSKNHGSHHVGQDVLDEDRPGSLCLTVGHLFLSSSISRYLDAESSKREDWRGTAKSSLWLDRKEEFRSRRTSEGCVGFNGGVPYSSIASSIVFPKTS